MIVESKPEAGKCEICDLRLRFNFFLSIVFWMTWKLIRVGLLFYRLTRPRTTTPLLRCGRWVSFFFSFQFLGLLVVYVNIGVVRKARKNLTRDASPDIYETIILFNYTAFIATMRTYDYVDWILSILYAWQTACLIDYL